MNDTVHRLVRTILRQHGASHVEGNRSELQRGSTLYKGHLVLGGYIQDFRAILSVLIATTPSNGAKTP